MENEEFNFDLDGKSEDESKSVRPPLPLSLPSPGPTRFQDNTVFTNEVFKNILDDVATTNFSTRKICKNHGVDYGTFKRWLRKDVELQTQYAQAKGEQMDEMAEEIIEIADEALEMKENMAEAQMRKLQVETRKWLMSKLAPKVYGDKMQHNIEATVNHNVNDDQFAKLMEAALSQKQIPSDNSDIEEAEEIKD